ncbi:hypothetical protein ACFR99_00825 [Haloarchaeobius amylolyticus]|uniref:Uncharacterized protein n=1 Tax=Haloarchaeobius amylolyticus TaxID=1198296 RepID=A0ABD6BBH4_9EURY
MSNLSSRRGLLALAGTGLAASLAGCSQLDSMSGSSDDESSNAVTLQIRPDEDEEASLSEEIQEEIDSGNISQQEAQLEYQERRLELVEAAATDFEESTADTDITIEESETAYGLFLAAGSDEAILDTLRDGAAGAIYSGEQYDALVQQQQQRAQQREQQRALLEQQQAAGNETNDSTTGNETDG